MYLDCISTLLLSLLAVPSLLLTRLLTLGDILLRVPVLVVPVPVLTLLRRHTNHTLAATPQRVSSCNCSV